MKYYDPKTYSDSKALLNAICDFEFVLGLCILKVILSDNVALVVTYRVKTLMLLLFVETRHLLSRH